MGVGGQLVSLLEPRLLLLPLNPFLEKTLKPLLDLLLELLAERRAILEGFRKNGLCLGLDCLVQSARKSLFQRLFDNHFDVDRHWLGSVERLWSVHPHRRR